MAIKADIVSQDERETLGIRILLNYGHTIGHALESTTEYGKFMHGEGVSIGMMGVARMGQQLGMISEDLVTRQRKLLQRFNLPIKAVGIPVDDIRLAMSLDKKVQSGTNRWVMLESVGTAVVRQDIPWDIVEDTLMHLTRE
jgi:3-dehydroquinate synthase